MIYIKTKDPTEKFEGISELTLGDYGTQNIGIAFGGPMQNKKLKYRLVLRTDYADGFRKNTYLNKSDTSKKDELTLRYKLNWELNETTNLDFLVSKVDMDDPADIWTIDGSLNTLSDRPGMDSQNTNSYGIKITKDFSNFIVQSLTSATKPMLFLVTMQIGVTQTHIFPTYMIIFLKHLEKEILLAKRYVFYLKILNFHLKIHTNGFSVFNLVILMNQI